MGWLKSVFSEENGNGSTARVCIASIVFTSCFVVIFLTVKNPLSLKDMFTGLTAFVTAVVTALYGINQLRHSVTDRKEPGCK